MKRSPFLSHTYIAATSAACWRLATGGWEDREPQSHQTCTYVYTTVCVPQKVGVQVKTATSLLLAKQCILGSKADTRSSVALMAVATYFPDCPTPFQLLMEIATVTTDNHTILPSCQMKIGC